VKKESGSVHLDPTTGFHPPLRGRGTRVVGLIQVLTLLISSSYLSFQSFLLTARGWAGRAERKGKERKELICAQHAVRTNKREAPLRGDHSMVICWTVRT
jgi:hypothetical protein